MASRRTLYLPVMIVAAVLAVSKEAEATFPGKPGKIAYAGYEESDWEIYTIKAGGGGRFNVTDNSTNDFSPSWGSSK